MSEKPARVNSTAIQKFSIPIQLTDRSLFEGVFATMKERFAEMRRIDEEMIKFSKNLLQLTGQNTTVHAGMTSTDRQSPGSGWEMLTKSPLLQGEGEDKVLQLQFDLSEFPPDEVTVEVLNNVLLVSAEHRETIDGSTVYSEFKREFLLPADTDPEAIESMLSNEGVLTIRAPFYIPGSSRSQSDEEN